MKIDLGRGRTGIKVLLGSLAFAASAGVALAQSYQFSTCGATGLSGPSQGDCNSAYAATSLAGAVTVTGGIQAWTVPQTGLYRIEAYGAQGGTQIFSPGFPGGLGAYISGEFNLVGGQIVYVLVGQRGGNTVDVGGEGNLDNAGAGGGGGSFAYFDASDAFPLVAAGGGAGGSRCSSVSGSLRNGNAGTSGNRSGSTDNGGSNGNGGLNNVGGQSYWAGGGSGWLTDGTGGNNSTNNDYTPGDSGAEGGRAPRNGGLGGVRWEDEEDDSGGDGGFGGGGGGGSDNMGSGGGGGFSGGGGANQGDSAECDNEPGGGGGSYNGGSNQVNLSANNAGDGAVTITAIDAVAAAVPTASTWALVLMALLLAVTGFVAVRRS